MNQTEKQRALNYFMGENQAKRAGYKGYSHIYDQGLLDGWEGALDALASHGTRLEPLGDVFERLEWWKKQYRKLYEGGAEKLAEQGVIVDDVETHMKAIHYMEAAAIGEKQ